MEPTAEDLAEEPEPAVSKRDRLAMIKEAHARVKQRGD